MSRQVYLLGAGLALVALSLAFTDWALTLRPGVTKANVKRVRPGMTVEEVEAILGDYSDSHVGMGIGTLPAPSREDFQAFLHTIAHDPDCGLDGVQLFKFAEAGNALIVFEMDGRVRQAKWLPTGRPSLGPLSRLR